MYERTLVHLLAIGSLSAPFKKSRAEKSWQVYAKIHCPQKIIYSIST